MVLNGWLNIGSNGTKNYKTKQYKKKNRKQKKILIILQVMVEVL
jgi:hypothetical protein